MKRFCFLLFSILLIIALALPAFAAEGEGETSGDTQTGSNSYYTTYITEDGDTINVAIDNTEEIVNTSEGAMVSYQTYPDSSAQVYSVTAADANGLKAVLLQFLGDYEGIVVEYAYENTNGYTSYVREIQLDYPWLCSAAILAIFIFCLFRLGGAILCKT